MLGKKEKTTRRQVQGIFQRPSHLWCFFPFIRVQRVGVLSTCQIEEAMKKKEERGEEREKSGSLLLLITEQ